MKACIYCGAETKVYNSRLIGKKTRRYRECPKCGVRFTTEEVLRKVLQEPYKEGEKNE